jgi:tetratricopeptide (TPR) repeat protein
VGAGGAGILPLTSGKRVGGTTVEALRSNFMRLRRLDDHLGGADTFHLYIAEVERSASLIKAGSLSAGTETALQVLFAEQAQQAGWAAFDTGWNQRATQLFERSFQSAQAANCSDLAGNALALRSYQLLSVGEQPSDLTDRSLRAAGTSSHPAVKSLLYQRGAWTYALAGDAQKTAWALSQASEALGESDTAGPGPDWATWAHNPLELEIMTGRCWAELHRPLRAIPALESAMSRYDDSHARDKALYLSWLADAYLDAGEVEQAALVTAHAIDLSSRVASTRPQFRFADVFERLRPHKAVPEVAELLSRGTFNPVQIRS